jgi:hypothetical protein
MFAILLSALAVGEAPAKAPAEPKPPPRILNAAIEKGWLVLEETDMRYVVQTRQETVTINDQKVVQTKTVTVPALVTQRRRVSLKGATFQDAGGTKYDHKEAAKLLAKFRPVVVSLDGKPVGPAYLKLLAKDTIVIVGPSATKIVEPDPNAEKEIPVPDVEPR